MLKSKKFWSYEVSEHFDLTPEIISNYKLKGKFYDFSGEVAAPGGAYCIPWDEMEAYDKLYYDRIVRDCIL